MDFMQPRSRLVASHCASGLLVVSRSAKIRLLIGPLRGRLLVLGIFRQPEIRLDCLVLEQD